jgi:tRNA modification GTPase
MTICHIVRLTPVGRGAVSSLLVEGCAAATMVDRFFRGANGRSLTQAVFNRIYFGHWYHQGCQVAEEVIVCRRAADQIEIHCHGGLSAFTSIENSLRNAGCCNIAWPEWLQCRTVDPLNSAARIALAQAKTRRVTHILLDQMQGAMRQEIRALVQLLQDQKLAAAQERLNRLLERARLGLHLVDPWRIVLAGQPNVGKSSLMNALLGYSRSIVRDQPGTTRDMISTETAFGGWPVELNDSAGLGTGTDPVEKAGVKLAWKMIRESDQVILVFDATLPWTEEQQQLFSEIPSALVVHNKVDGNRLFLNQRPEGLLTSTVNGQGIQELSARLEALLVPEPPPAGAAIPCDLDQVQVLREAMSSLVLGATETASSELRRLLSG